MAILDLILTVTVETKALGQIAGWPICNVT
jgi:hypothetical protein